MTPRLAGELRRLFLPSPSAGGPTDAELAQRLDAREGIPAPLRDAAGRVRLLVLGFHGVRRGQGAAHCDAVLKLARTLMEVHGLPEPALSVDGAEGYELWLPLAEPVAPEQAQEFLALLRQLYLPELPALVLRPGADDDGGPVLPPALRADTGLWAVFIAPGLAPSFTEEPGIDMPANLDKQAELLARLEPIATAAFAEALQALRSRVAPTAAEPPTAGAEAPPGAVGRALQEPASMPVPLARLRDGLRQDLLQPPAPVPVPLAGLAALLQGGFRGGRLCVAVAAGPLASALAGQCLDHAAAQGHAGLWLGGARTAAQFVAGALARRLGIEASRLEAGALPAEEAARVADALDGYLAHEGQRLALQEGRPGEGLSAAEAWAAQAVAAAPGRTPLVVVDPLPLVGSGLAAWDAHPDAALRAAAQAAACKDLARRSGAAVLALWPAPAAVRAGAVQADAALQALAEVADAVLVLQAEPAAGDRVPARLSLLAPGGVPVALSYRPALQAFEAGAASDEGSGRRAS